MRRVESVIAENLADGLELARYDERYWVVSTPYEFGAQNWMLCLAFDQKRLGGYHVGTYDYLFAHVSDAPPDLGSVPHRW